MNRNATLWNKKRVDKSYLLGRNVKEVIRAYVAKSKYLISSLSDIADSKLSARISFGNTIKRYFSKSGIVEVRMHTH